MMSSPKVLFIMADYGHDPTGKNIYSFLKQIRKMAEEHAML
jgi:hypothetical protein